MLRTISVLALGALLGLCPVIQAAPAIPPAAPAKVCAAIVYDLGHDAILFEQNADERIPPASLTKVMSMFLALDHVRAGHSSLDGDVAVSSFAAGQGGSRMGLRAHESLPLRKLLLGMAVSSGNDASMAVAEHVGGSESAFVNMMNARARFLGMDDSSFANPHGLPHPGQYTTARDMLTLARAYLREHPKALELHNARVLEHGGLKTWNKNPLLGQYPGADGLKTGWIRASGHNLIFTATRGGRRLLAVILGAPDAYMRGVEACRLLDAGFMVCSNDAVSVAAALASVEPRQIDLRKTPRENGIAQRRYVASKKAKTRAQYAQLKGKWHKPRGTSLTRKNTRIAQQRKAGAKVRTHAERRSAKAKRG